MSSIRRGQRIAGYWRRYQFQLGAVRELDVLIADPIVMRPPWLERESQSAIVVGSLVKIVDGNRDVVEAGHRCGGGGGRRRGCLCQHERSPGRGERQRDRQPA